MREPARVDPLHARGAALALASAVLFGLSTPYSKILLQRIGPLHLAALLYLGAGAALLLARPLQRRLRVPGSSEAPLRAADLPVLLAATFCGAILGPSLMMFGLARV